jgi:hypothetical protein
VTGEERRVPVLFLIALTATESARLHAWVERHPGLREAGMAEVLGLALMTGVRTLDDETWVEVG